VVKRDLMSNGNDKIRIVKREKGSDG
jgi:hypothetical protein